ncbi:MAG: PAS domain S-box protein [Nitrospirota bacterium]
MTECASELRKLGAGASSAQDVAQQIASYLYQQLGNDQTGRQDCVLVRCFLTRAYGELDSQTQDCARRVLACEPGSLDMKCLTLFGTAGERPEWNERHRSRRYRSIPLADKQVVSQFPMVSQLLQQLGVDVTSKTSHNSDRPVDWIERTLNVFHVAEAKGSPFVPAQEEFVIPLGIESVLGFGGVFPSNEFFTVILFSKQKISRETAELFKPLAMSVKLALLPFDGSGSKRSINPVERQPEQWQARAEALEQLLVVHEQTVTHHALQRKRAEEALRESEERHRLLVTQASDIIYRTDVMGRFTFVNPTATRIMKYSEQELLGLRFIELIRSDQQQAAERFYRHQFVRKRLSTYYEFPAIAKDGSEVWIGQHVQVLQEDGTVVGFQAVARDITERKRVEQKQDRLIEDLTQSQQHFQALFNWTPSAVGISTVAEGRFCIVNDGFSRLTGYQREEVIGRTTLELGLWADPLERATVLREIRKQGYLHNQEGLLRTKSGEIRSLMVSVDSIQLGSTPCLIYLAHDITERKRAEEALRLAKFSVERAADAVYWIDPQAKVLDVNEAASVMLGYSKEELCAMTVHDLNPDFQTDMWPGFWAETKRCGTMEFETTHRAKDGRLIPIEVSVNYLSHEGKEYHCAFVRDITERKRAEEELRRSEAFITSVVENLPSMIFVKDAKDLKFVRFNKAGEALLGHSREALIGKSDYDLFPKEEADFFTSKDRQVLNARSLLDIPEEPIETKHQGLRILHTRKIPIYGEKGEPQYLLGISEDITNRKRAEEARKESEEQYRSIFENAVEGIFQTTRDGKYVAVNPALARMYGYDSPEDLIAAITNIASQLYVDPERRDEFVRLMQQQEEVTGFEALVYRKDGSFIWISENVRTRRDPAGVLVGYEGMVEHITERKLAEARLRATLDEVRTLSGRLTKVQEEERTRIARELHDEFGVGLTCLKIDLSRLHTMVSEGAGAGACKKAGDKIRSMVEQIDTTIASVQRLVTELRPAILDDLGLVAAVEWQCQDFQKRTGIPCICVTSADDIAMEPERATALFRICQEALTNTARHAQATAVTIKLESRSNFLQLVVADNGVGIPETKLSNRQSLGLIGMKERVALFGGEITIQGHPGKGTTVTACLPRRLS